MCVRGVCGGGVVGRGGAPTTTTTATTTPTTTTTTSATTAKGFGRKFSLQTGSFFVQWEGDTGSEYYSADSVFPLTTLAANFLASAGPNSGWATTFISR